MSLHQNDTVMESLAEYLDENSKGLNDILRDDKGYYFVTTYDFTDSEGGQVNTKNVYLPDEFQELNLN